MKFYWKLGAILFIAFTLANNETFAAISCPGGGGVLNVPVATTVIVNGPCNYTDVTVSGTIISDVGEKTDMTVSGTLTINTGGGIDVSGKGNNATGLGTNGTNVGGTTSCTGTYAGGGGGGGYGGAGTNGTIDCCGSAAGVGGIAYGSSTNPIDLGSSGGLGGGNTSGAGMGGGAVKISAPNIIINGFIRANGTAGSDPIGNDGTGGGGGGSGGSIWLVASNSFNFTGGTLEAKGGNGGVDVNCGGSDGPGGPGSGGRISLQYKGPKIGTGSIPSVAGGTFSGTGNPGTFIEDPCYTNTCDNYCGGTDGLTAYFGGTCDVSTGVCNYTSMTNCTDTDTCTFDSCNVGLCSNSPICGGLVPCGRVSNNPNTIYDETAPCALCHIFIMLQMIVTFVVEIGGIIAVFFLVIGGLIYSTSAGDQGRMETGKKAMMWARFSVWQSFFFPGLSLLSS